MAGREARRDKITVILPPEPPELNPEAARVLLRILLNACESDPAAAERALRSRKSSQPKSCLRNPGHLAKGVRQAGASAQGH